MPSTNQRTRTLQPTGPASLETRIREVYAVLPGSELAVADALLIHPGRLATHSATELAIEAGASKASVTRLIRRLGYASYASARAQARIAQEWGSPVYLDSEPAVGGGYRAALAHHVAADQQLLARTLGGLSEDDLGQALSALASSRRVVVVGFRNSAWLAMYARAQIGLLRPGVELAPLPTETLAEAMAELGAEDVVLAIGLRRRTTVFSAALRVAHGAKARIILLTDPSGAADLAFADWTLTCHSRGASIFDSYVGAISLLNFTTSQLASLLGDKGRKRLQAVEHWHGQLGDLA